MYDMKLWIDDIRPAPKGYYHCFSVNETKRRIEAMELFSKKSGSKKYYAIEVIDIDHDAGSFVNDGGDYIELLNWLERTGRSYPIHIHSMNPVGVENMRRIIKRNGWLEVR